MFLSVENISKSYGRQEEGTLRRVLRDLIFTMNQGESIAILGSSGAGKTTLLNIIGTLDAPDTGRVLFNGQNVVDMRLNELDHFRNRQIGFIFQFHHLLPQCTLFENALIPTLPIKDFEEKRQKAERAGDLLKRVGLWDHRSKIPSKLSGGECQRVAEVRAMINQPVLLLADEPTGALDRQNAEVITDLLIDLNKEDGVSLLVVTHSEKLASKMDRIFYMSDGQMNSKPEDQNEKREAL